MLKNRLAANSGSYHANPLEQALAGIAAAGFQYVELTAIRGVAEHVPLDADEQVLHKIKEMLAKEGLTAISLAGHSDLTTAEGVKDGLLALNLCEQLGISFLNTAVGGAFNENEDENAFMRNIHGFAREAARCGVNVGIEIHGSLTSDGEKTRRLIQKVNHPNVGINYDTANCEFFGGLRAEVDLPSALPYVIHCHLKDTVGGQRIWNFPAIGRGHLDFRNILSQFEAAGYLGPFSVELEFQGEPYPPLEEINGAMRESYEFLRRLGLGSDGH